MADRKIRVTVNGTLHEAEVEPRLLLVHFIREMLRLTGTHIGCETTTCGACTVLLDGQPIKSCTAFAVQADGRPRAALCSLALAAGARGRSLRPRATRRHSEVCRCRRARSGARA